jgi:hypothetical protein
MHLDISKLEDPQSTQSHLDRCKMAFKIHQAFLTDINELKNNKRFNKSDWGTLVPSINVKNVIKLGFILE